MKYLKTLSIISALVILVYSCKKDNQDSDLVPAVFVDITIDLNNPEYNSLNNLGGATTLIGGVKGIILYHSTSDEYFAYERNCTFEPSNTCSTVSIDSVGFQATDSCCNSVFQLMDGSPIGGPAVRPLVRYNTFLNSSLLSITNN
jgi:nitrite reductase/ring-hydroxylating ferredoxin subunit